MKINRDGLSFKYYEDILTIPWTISFYFISSVLERTFGNLRDYWKARGVREYKEPLLFSKMEGFNWEEEILLTFIKQKLPLGIFVVLYDLDLSRKTADFWAKIPPEKRSQLTKDVVVMKCDSLSQADQIATSIELDIGKALIVRDNQLIGWNGNE